MQYRTPSWDTQITTNFLLNACTKILKTSLTHQGEVVTWDLGAPARAMGLLCFGELWWLPPCAPSTTGSHFLPNHWQWQAPNPSAAAQGRTPCYFKRVDTGRNNFSSFLHGRRRSPGAGDDINKPDELRAWNTKL